MQGRYYEAFAQALVDWQRSVPEHVAPPQNGRFGVYRGNVASGLVEALGVRYPVVRRLVGDEFFRAMGREYALSHLPASPVLIEWGGDFPLFVAQFPPAATVAYLADVARVESAYWQAYHAADEAPLAADAFRSLDPGMLDRLRVRFLSSVHVLASRWPVLAIWRTNTEDEEVRPVDLGKGEDVLVVRPEMAVMLQRLPPGAATFLTSLLTGATLAAAAESAFEVCPEFDLAVNLAGLIQSRAAAEIIP